MANFRATAAGGKWSEITAWEEETAPTVWAPAAKAPGETDDVVFEASAGSITVAAEAKCRSLDATNYKKTFKIEAAQKFKVGAATSNGGLCVNLGAGMTMSGSGTINFVSTSGTTEKIKSNGKEWGNSIHLFFEGTGGVWEFADALNAGFEISLEKGEIKTAGATVTTKSFFITGTSKIALGASRILLNRASAGLWNIATTATLEAGTSTIEIEGTGESSKEFVGGKKTYNRVVILGDNVLIREANTFAELAINTRGNTAKGTSFEKTVAQTITVSFTTNALPGEKILLKSQTVGKAWKLKVTSGVVEVSNVEIEDSAAEGGAIWIDRGVGGQLPLNRGNNTGWRFMDEEVTAQQYLQRPPNLFSPSGLNIALIDPFPPFFHIPSEEGHTPVTYEHTFEASQGQAVTHSETLARTYSLTQGQSVTKSVTVAKKFPLLVQISGPGEGVFIIGGTSSLEPFTDTVAQSGIVTANGKAGEETRIKATGGLVRLTNGLVCFHNAHEWVPPNGGGSTRWDIIWLGEAKKTALGGLAKAFLIGDAELELSEALAAELAEGAILRIDEETFTVKKTAAGATKVVIKTRAIRETVEANHLIGKAVSLLGSEPDVKAEPPGIVGYELNIGYSSVSLADAKQKVAELLSPITGRAWGPVAIVEVPAGATKSSQFTFYDVRSFNFLPSPLTSVSVIRSLSQAQTVVHSETLTRTFSLTQGQSAMKNVNVGRSYSLTQGQTVTRSENVGKNLSLTQGQAVTRSESVGKNFSLSQGSSATLAHSLTYIVALEQGQAVAFVRSPAKTAAIEQGQSVTFSRGVSRSYSLTQGQTVVFSRGVGKNLSLSQGQSVTVSSSIGRVFTLSQGQTVTRSEAITHYFTPTQGQSVTRSENVTHTFSCSQSQSAICGRGYLTTLNLEQSQSATLSRTSSITRSISQGQTVTCTRALSVTRSLSQGQIVTRSVNVNATRTLSQGQTVTHSETPTRVFALTQEQTVSLRRQVAHIFTSSQGQTVVVEFVESLKAIMEALVVMVRPRVALAIPVGVMRMVVSQSGALPVISFTRSQPVISVERAQRSTLGKR